MYQKGVQLHLGRKAMTAIRSNGYVDNPITPEDLEQYAQTVMMLAEMLRNNDIIQIEHGSLSIEQNNEIETVSKGVDNWREYLPTEQCEFRLGDGTTFKRVK